MPDATETIPRPVRHEHAPNRRQRLADHSKRPVVIAAAISFGLCALVAILELRIGVSFKDEGYLWYGVQRTVAGEWPIMDFRAYDPGRYLWSAAWKRVLGDGILSLRAAAWIFAASGLTAGLLASRRVVRTLPGLVGTAVALIPWMVPRHKRFDFVLPLAAILAAVRMIERRDTSSHIVAGTVAGMAAFVGRNHGVYLAVAMTAIVWVITPPERWAFAKRLAALAGGTLLGCLPMLALWVIFPRFLPAFVAMTTDVVGNSAGKSLPVPWPWRGGDVPTVLFGMLLVAAPLLYTITAARLLRRRRSLEGPYDSLMLAATAIGLPYLHHAFSRAEPYHFFQASAPFVLLVVAYAASAWHRSDRRVLGAAIVGGLAVFTLILPLPRWHLYRYLASPERFRTAAVGADQLLVTRAADATLRFFDRFAEKADDDPIFVTSNYVSVYAIMQRRSPVYDTYMVHRRSTQQQAEIIQALDDGGVQWALIMSEPRLHKTHPDVLEHIQTNWKRVQIRGTPADGAVYRRMGS